MDYQKYVKRCEENNIPPMDYEEYEAGAINIGLQRRREESRRIFDIGKAICGRKGIGVQNEAKE